MKNWEKFEVNAVKLLNDHLKKIDNNFNFENEGGKDSTKSDIKVSLNKKELFKIEAKMSKAQCGQFVIKMEKEYKLSEKSKTTNTFTSKIIDFINENISKYEIIEQSAIDLNCESDLLSGWVIEHYKNKNSDWLITSNSFENLNIQNTAIYSINDLKKYFKVTACLRRKLSGSSDLPKSMDKIAENELKKLYSNESIGLRRENKKLIATIENFSSSKWFGPDNKFYLSEDGRLTNNEYYVKKLSNTNSVNVIFSIQWSSDPSTSQFNILKNKLESYI